MNSREAVIAMLQGKHIHSTEKKCMTYWKYDPTSFPDDERVFCAYGKEHNYCYNSMTLSKFLGFSLITWGEYIPSPELVDMEGMFEHLQRGGTANQPDWAEHDYVYMNMDGRIACEDDSLYHINLRHRKQKKWILLPKEDEQ